MADIQSAAAEIRRGKIRRRRRKNKPHHSATIKIPANRLHSNHKILFEINRNHGISRFVAPTATAKRQKQH